MNDYYAKNHLAINAKEVNNQVVVSCACGYEISTSTYVNAMQLYANHYAMETQAAKPRVKRDGVDRSDPSSRSHKQTLAVLYGLFPKEYISIDAVAWYTAERVHSYQYAYKIYNHEYTPQRVRTCLAGLVRAGLVDERKTGKYKEYCINSSGIDYATALLERGCNHG